MEVRNESVDDPTKPKFVQIKSGGVEMANLEFQVVENRSWKVRHDEFKILSLGDSRRPGLTAVVGGNGKRTATLGQRIANCH